jgi:DNA-directed RNA polymerase specialized sigma24 family protein
MRQDTGEDQDARMAHMLRLPPRKALHSYRRPRTDLSVPMDGAITLRIFDKRTPGKVSDIMGMARATVRCHISRGVKRLRGFMKGTVPGVARQEVAF